MTLLQRYMAISNEIKDTNLFVDTTITDTFLNSKGVPTKSGLGILFTQKTISVKVGNKYRFTYNTVKATSEVTPSIRVSYLTSNGTFSSREVITVSKPGVSLITIPTNIALMDIRVDDPSSPTNAYITDIIVEEVI